LSFPLKVQIKFFFEQVEDPFFVTEMCRQHSGFGAKTAAAINLNFKTPDNVFECSFVLMLFLFFCLFIGLFPSPEKLSEDFCFVSLMFATLWVRLSLCLC